jgi:hypothetical protein
MGLFGGGNSSSSSTTNNYDSSNKQQFGDLQGESNLQDIGGNVIIENNSDELAAEAFSLVEELNANNQKSAQDLAEAGLYTARDLFDTATESVYDNSRLQYAAQDSFFDSVSGLVRDVVDTTKSVASNATSAIVNATSSAEKSADNKIKTVSDSLLDSRRETGEAIIQSALKWGTVAFGVLAVAWVFKGKK